MIYTFREEAIIYTTVVANSEKEAWVKLDQVVFEVPPNMDVDVLECEIIDIGEEQ